MTAAAAKNAAADPVDGILITDRKRQPVKVFHGVSCSGCPDLVIITESNSGNGVQAGRRAFICLGKFAKSYFRLTDNHGLYTGILFKNAVKGKSRENSKKNYFHLRP